AARCPSHTTLPGHVVPLQAFQSAMAFPDPASTHGRGLAAPRGVDAAKAFALPQPMGSGVHRRTTDGLCIGDCWGLIRRELERQRGVTNFRLPNRGVRPLLTAQSMRPYNRSTSGVRAGAAAPLFPEGVRHAGGAIDRGLRYSETGMLRLASRIS